MGRMASDYLCWNDYSELDGTGFLLNGDSNLLPEPLCPAFLGCVSAVP